MVPVAQQTYFLDITLIRSTLIEFPTLMGLNK